MRETGYYWVKRDEIWLIGFYDKDDKLWDLFDSWHSSDYLDVHLNEINETRIKNPDEK